MIRRGLTLIELLVSIGLGLMLLTLGVSALAEVTRISKRDTAQRRGHEDAAVIQRRLRENLGGLYHPAQMRLEADPGPDGSWGSGDEVLRLLWMTSVRSLAQDSMDYAPPRVHDLAWCELVWSGDGEGGGELELATSTGERVREWYSYQWVDHTGATRNERFDITNAPQPRRDRRRDLDDNDLRHLPGMTGTVLDDIGLPGDREDLADQLAPLHPPVTEVVSCSFEWIDAGGVIVRCDAASGVTLTSPSGSTVPTLGTSWSNQRGLVIDGTWLDGRPHTPPGDTRGVLEQRPALVRISLELVPRTESGLDLAEEPHYDFTFTFATAPELPPL